MKVFKSASWPNETFPGHGKLMPRLSSLRRLTVWRRAEWLLYAC